MVILMASKGVAPKAKAASFCSGSIAWKISRHNPVIVGLIMMARMREALRKPMPKLTPSGGKKGSHAKEGLEPRGQCCLHPWSEVENAPESKDDGGDRR